MKGLLSFSQSVNQSVSQNHFFSKTAHRMFMKFHINFSFLKDKNVKKKYSQEKNFWEKARNIFKNRLFGVGEKLFHWCAIFGFTWCTIVVVMILQKLHVLEKSLSQVINESVLGQSDCKIFQILISQRLFGV